MRSSASFAAASLGSHHFEEVHGGGEEQEAVETKNHGDPDNSARIRAKTEDKGGGGVAQQRAANGG